MEEVTKEDWDLDFSQYEREDSEELNISTIHKKTKR